MVSGCITEKKGYLYAILNLYNKEGKRKQKWIATGLRVKGNKKLAQQRLESVLKPKKSSKTA